MYVVPVPWSAQHSAYFHKTQQFLRHVSSACTDTRRFLEKSKIRWFDARELLVGKCDAGRLRKVFAETIRKNASCLSKVFEDAITKSYSLPCRECRRSSPSDQYLLDNRCNRLNLLLIRQNMQA